MLLNKIAETRKTFEEYRKIDNELRKVRRISSFSQLAKSEINKIKATLASYHALNQVDSEAFPKRKLNYELKQLDALISGVEKATKDEINSFAGLFKQLDDDLKMRWSYYVLNKNSDIIGLLERLTNIASNPQEIRQLISELKTFDKKWPVTQITLNRYFDHLSRANKVISEMNASKGVQDFITKVASNRATIDDLTDEVIEWLRTKELTNKLVIKFK